MIKYNKCLVAFCLLPFAVSAQNESIETDLPSESYTPTTVLKKYFQFEIGVRREHDVKDGQRHDEYLYPSAFIKYGVTKKFELRLLLEDEVDYDYMPDKQKTASGLKTVRAGFKYNLFANKGLLPKTSLLSSIGIPKWASSDFKTNFAAPQVRLLMENAITKKFKVVYNIGEEWEDDDVHGKFLYSICPELNLTDKIVIFAETYGFFLKGESPEHTVDGGILYQFSPNVQMSLFGGLGISKAAPDNYIEAGFSFRLPI